MAGKFVGALMVGAGLMVGHASAQAPEEKVLNIYNWSDYIAEDRSKTLKKKPASKSVMMFSITTKS